MKQNIIAVDFDGTLCENKWPEIGMPNEELIEYLKKRQANGEKLILWTSRNEEQTKEAVEWCKKYGLIFDAVNDNLPEIVEAFGGNCRKIFANEYIDDRNRSIGSCREKWSERKLLKLGWRQPMDRNRFIQCMKSNIELSDKERRRIIRRSVESQPWKLKCTIAMEEFAELTQAISKQIRGYDNRIGLLEEMADAYICLEFLKSIFNITPEELQKAMDVKLQRERNKQR